MAQPKLSINIPQSPSRRLSDISLSPVRVYDVDQLRLLPPELDAKAQSDPVLAQYLYFTVVAGPEEQAVFEEQTRLWVLKTLALPDSFEDTSRLSFAKRLRNGVIACRLLHSLWPQLRSEPINSPSGRSAQPIDPSRRNLEAFLDGCEALGVSVATAHSTRDQLRHDILSYTSTRAIIYCLLELSRLAAAQGLASPPPIVALEAAIDAGDSSDVLDSARSVLDQIEGSAPSRTSSPSSSSGSDSDHGRTQRAESVASSTAASALSRSESEPSTTEGPTVASQSQGRPSRGRRSSSISVQIVSESDAECSERAVSMSVEVGEAAGASSLFANFEAHSTTPLSRQQPEVRRSKWRTIATAPDAAQPSDIVVVSVSSEPSAASSHSDAVAPSAPTPSALNADLTPTAQAPRNRFFFAELSPRSALANRLSGGAYARSKWRSIAVSTEHGQTTPMTHTAAVPSLAAGEERQVHAHPQAPPPTPISPRTGKAAATSGKQEASFDSPEGSKPVGAPSSASSPITFLHDYLPVAGDIIDEAVAACFLRNKLRVRPVRLSKGNYLFSSVNRVLRSPRNQHEALSPRLKRAARVFSFGGGSIEPSMLSAFPFPVTPVSSTTASGVIAPTDSADTSRTAPSSPSVSMSLSLSGSETEGPIAVEAPVRLISGALLVRYDGLWMDLRSFVSHFIRHVSAARKARMITSLNNAIDTPLTSSPRGVSSDKIADTMEDATTDPVDMDDEAGVCESDVIVLEDQLRECFLDTMLPKLAHYDVSKIGHFSSELLFRKAIAEGVSCDRYDEFLDEELGRLTRYGSSRKHGYDTQPSPAPHGAKRPHPTPAAPVSDEAAFPARTQHSQIRQFVKRLLRR